MKVKNFLLEKVSPKLLGMAFKESFKILVPGGPLLIAGSEILGTVLESGLEEVINRSLTEREEFRVGYSAIQIYSEINKRLIKGDRIRSDEVFFLDNGMYQSNANEILEGILLACKREHEEKKIIYISNILANIVFDSEIGIEEANHIVKLAEELTYRQLILLRIFEDHKFGEFNIRDFKLSTMETWELSYNQEIIEMTKLGILAQLDTDYYGIEGHEMTSDALESLVQRNAYIELSHCTQVIPKAVVSTSYGYLLYDLMGLSEIPHEDVTKTMQLLR
ncbi:hypothetical protein [Paenibacillus humicus]|uniref:hypothetical protein n=1 Tax=Paenibacillus humicus TaxID=412861 RepID=UPI003F14B501